MFGYVRPFEDELKINEYRLYRSAYCGLCRELGKRYGLFYRFTLQYDYAFLALLLSSGEHSCRKACCPRHPFRGQDCLCGMALSSAADVSVILTYQKLRDSVLDSKGVRRFAFRVIAAMLSKGYRKAAGKMPHLSEYTAEKLEALHRLENEHCDSLDAPADCFAALLAESASAEPDRDRRRIFAEILYHVGRMIYIIDSVDDLPDDKKAGRYNPLVYRFRNRWGDEEKDSVRETLLLSLGRAQNALNLLDSSPARPVLENILNYGIPSMMESVLAGRGKRDKITGRTTHE